MFPEILLVILLILLIAIAYYTYVNMTQKPSDMHPFADLAQVIDPSVLPDAKDDYNDIILTLFDVINKQDKVLSFPNVPEYNNAITKAMEPKLKVFSKKYTPEVATKLLKYFVIMHITALLDNYYTGPPINLMVPANPFLRLEAFPFNYSAKTSSKVTNASNLIPFKYLAYNIPKKIRAEVTTIYDNMFDRYAQAVNEAVSKLPEINEKTIKQVNVMALMMKYQKMMTEDLDRIKKLFGSNMYKLSKKVFMQNVVPLLDKYYKGPGIDIIRDEPRFNMTAPIRKLSIKYPNKDRKSIYEITETDTKTNTTKSLTSSVETDSTAASTAASTTVSTTVSTTASR
jgi:hypothetical protein